MGFGGFVAHGRKIVNRSLLFTVLESTPALGADVRMISQVSLRFRSALSRLDYACETMKPIHGRILSIRS